MADDPLDRDLEQMAGSPELAKAVRQSLERLRGGAAGAAMAEMATELLEGRTDLRTVARSSAYANDLLEGVDKFSQWEAELTPEERQRFAEEAHETVYGEND